MTAPSSPAAAFAALGIPDQLAQALETRGFTELTPVQRALIDPELADRDVLVSAQTGSGKTVAFGLLVAPSLLGERPRAERGAAMPRAVVITPTRELANQVREELAWLLEPRGARVVVVTGGTSITGERRALAAGADIVVGTPGRLNDHLSKNAIVGTHVQTVVLDEADEMLDMGFRDELEQILKALPTERRTVMLSATLPREIQDLAKNYQRNPARIAIDPPGASNENISYVAMLVPPSHRVDAVVNILLAAPDERTMVFVRTRADATDIAAQLSQLGFAAAALQGEMGQRERTQTLDAFRAGRVQALVATDVAARGLDVPEVTCVIHADLPGDPSALTHRSGRTGRAGRRGTSVLLVPAFARRRAESMLRAAGARAEWTPPPGVAEIERAAAERVQTRLTDESRTPNQPELALARTLLAARDAESLVALLLDEARWRGTTAPRPIGAGKHVRDERGARPERGERFDRGERFEDRGPRSRPREERDRENFAMFRVNYGVKHGATASRLLAMMCRRGGVRGSDIGAISIDEAGSTFGVSRAVADSFADAASRRDTREPHLHIEPADGRAPTRSAPQDAPPPRPRPAPRSFGPSDDRADVFAAELDSGDARKPARAKHTPPPTEAAPAPHKRAVIEEAPAPKPHKAKPAHDDDWVALDDDGPVEEAPRPAKRTHDEPRAAHVEKPHAAKRAHDESFTARPKRDDASRGPWAAKPRDAEAPRAKRSDDAPRAWSAKSASTRESEAPRGKRPFSSAPPWSKSAPSDDAKKPYTKKPWGSSDSRSTPTGPGAKKPYAKGKPWDAQDARRPSSGGGDTKRSFGKGTGKPPWADRDGAWRPPAEERAPAAPKGAGGNVQTFRARESGPSPIETSRAKRAHANAPAEAPARKAEPAAEPRAKHAISWTKRDTHAKSATAHKATKRKK